MSGAPGRPPQPHPDTLAKGRLYLELTRLGFTKAEIAARVGLSRSDVYRAVNLVQPTPDAAAIVESQRRPKRRMSRPMLLLRTLKHVDRLRVLDWAVAAAWMRIVVAVHEDGDGLRLHLGEYGYPYRSRAELGSSLFGCAEAELAVWLDELFHRGLLMDLDGDIGLPANKGLTLEEDMTPAKARAGRRPAPFEVVHGGLSERMSEETPISSDTLSELMSELMSEKTPISSDSGNLGRGKVDTTTTTMKTDTYPGSSSPLAAPAMSEETPISSDINSDINSDTVSEETSIQALAMRAKEAAAYPMDLTKRDRAAVRAWIKAGVPAELALRVIRDDRAGADPKPVWGLGLFTKPILAAFTLEREKPAEAPPAAPEAEAEERATAARIAKAEEGLGPELAAPRTNVRIALKCQVGEALYRSWLDRMILASVEEGVVTINLPTPFIRDWVQANYGERLLALWKIEIPEIRSVRFGVQALPPVAEAAD